MQTGWTVRTLTGALVGLIAVALVAGCDDDSDSSKGASRSPSTSLSASSAPAATDLSACRNANCQVSVKVGDQLGIDHKFGVDKITVKAIDADRIRLALEGTSGGFDAQGQSVSVSSSCTNDQCQDVGDLTLTTARPGRVNDVRLELVSATREQAVLRLYPR